MQEELFDWNTRTILKATIFKQILKKKTKVKEEHVVIIVKKLGGEEGAYKEI